MLPSQSGKPNFTKLTSEDDLVALRSETIALPEATTGCLMPRASFDESKSGREKRQLEFEDGRKAAQIAMKIMGCDGEVRTRSDRCPIWPAGIVGSISHSDNFAWAVTGPGSEFLSIGIDTEPVAEKKTVESLRSEIGVEAEWQLAESVGLSPPEAFTTVFSAKESIYKCIYPLSPVFFGFHNVRVVEVNSKTMTIQIQPDCPNQYLRDSQREKCQLEISYSTTSNNVFTACWLPLEKGIR